MTEKIEVKVGQERIIGIYHPGNEGQNVCVITCHGLLASKDGPKYHLLARELNTHGYSCVRFDFRGCGESEGNLKKSHITNRLEDLEAVVDYVIQELGYKRIGLFGSSMGGYVSFLKASSDQRIKALVSLASPFSMAELFNARSLDDESYEVDGIAFGGEFLSDVRANGTLKKNALGDLKCPTLIFHGTLDLLVPVEHARRLFESLNTEKMLEIIPGGDHIFSNPLHLTQIISASSEWFQKYLPVE